MRWRTPIATAVALLAAVSCDGNLPTAVTDEGAVTEKVDLQVSNQGQVVTEAVTGSAHYTNNVGNLRTLTFAVRQYADGSVRGVFLLVGHAQPPNVSRGPLTCVSVVDNEAWIGGFYEKSSNPALVGTGFGFYVKDNGEGAGALPDLVRRHVRGQANPDDWCSSMPDVSSSEFLYEVEEGNVQIH